MCGLVDCVIALSIVGLIFFFDESLNWTHEKIEGSVIGKYPMKMKSILKIKVSSVITEHTALASLKVSASKSSSDNLYDTIPSTKTNKIFSLLFILFY